MSTFHEQRVKKASGLIGMAIGTKRGSNALIEHGDPQEFPPELRPVAEVLFEIHHDGQEPTIGEVFERLKGHGHQAFTLTRLTDLVTSCLVNPAYCRAEIERMREFQAADLLTRTARSIGDKLAGGALPDGLLDEIRQDLLAAVDDSGTSSVDSSIDAYDAAQNALHQMDRAAAGESDPVLPHGIPELRGLVRGLAAGRLYVIAGRTSAGKSLVAVEMLRHATSHHIEHLGRRAHAVLASLEMGGEEIYQRMLAAEFHTPEKWFQHPKGSFTLQRWQQIREHVQDKRKRINMRIAGSAGQPGRKVRTMAQIESLARIEHRRGRCDLLLIDHVGLVTGPERDMRLRVKDTAERAKALAEDLRIPVVLVSQLNREGAKEHAPPTLFQMSESSAIEQSADTVLLVHRPNRWFGRSEHEAYWAQESGGKFGAYIPGIEPLDINVAKNRGGETRELSIAIDFPCYRLSPDMVELHRTRKRAPEAGTSMGRQPLPEPRVSPTVEGVPQETKQ